MSFVLTREIIQCSTVLPAGGTETMLTDRTYRKACTRDECPGELESIKSILYDAWVVDVTLS
jgi:hypothetical protein